LEHSDHLSIEMRDIPRSLRRHWALASGIVLAGFLGALYYVSSMYDAYRASTTLYIESPVPSGPTAPLSDAANIAKALLGSGMVTMRALEIAHESDRPILSAPKGKLPAGFDFNIDGRLITLHVIDVDPNRAARLANAWSKALEIEMAQQAPAILGLTSEQQQSELRKLKEEWVQRQGDFQKLLANTGFEVVQYGAGKPADSGAIRHPLEAILESLNVATNEKLMQINALKAEDELFRNAKAEPGDLLQLPRARGDFELAALHSTLERLQSELQTRRVGSSPDSNEIKKLEKSRNDTLSEIEQAAQRFARQVAMEIKLRTVALDGLQAQQKQKREALNAAQAKLPELFALMTDMQAAQARYTSALQQPATPLEQADLVRILEVAESPQQPIKAAKPIPYLIAGLVLSAVLAAALCLLLELSSNKVRSAKDVARNLGIKTLWPIPAQTSSTEPAVCEAVHKLSLGIDLARNGSTAAPIVIAITPAGVGDNCTKLGEQLATVVSGPQKKVLLLDVSSLRSIAGVPTLAELIAGKETAISPIPDGAGFDRISATASAGSCSLEQSALQPFFTSLAAKYHSIVVVVPSALVSANAALLAKVSAATILVARSRQTKLSELERSLETLTQIRNEKCLVVIEGVDDLDSSDA
jgi:uncharacterized protein involved in exopolysaccharide biosynthesis